MYRNVSRWLLGICLSSLAVESALAQVPYFPAPGLPPSPGPLMYVRFTAPKGTKLTLYRGADVGHTLDLPATVGFRPGYAYRLAVSDVPNLPGQVFSPTLEVRGSLALQSTLRNADYPAPLHFHEDDFGKALGGALVRKVIALERPDQAMPVASKPDQPIEIAVPASRDPYVEAAERGQPLIVLRMGQRHVTAQELKSYGQPGTILLPGERVLGSPRIAPYLPWYRCPVYDPVHGPRHPSEFVTLFDGGDVDAPAGFNRFGKLKGLDPTDTIAEYMDSRGVKRLAVSNRVGLCVPRFILFHGEIVAASSTARSTLNGTIALHSPGSTVGQSMLLKQEQIQRTEGVGSQLRLSRLYHSLGVSVTGRVQGVDIRTTARNTEFVEAIAIGPTLPEPADGPLRIIKWPDKACVNVGEIVTFHLKYSNTGGQPITNVVVADNLTARLEYVKGSTKTDRDATFTIEPNETGSSVLRWQITGALQPREHGLITFQVRVR
jgi:uncharacterized repeat protein (TIGR01451 family)